MCIYTHTYIYMHVYVYMYICIHVCVCICIYMYMEKAMAPHSSTLAWKIPWTEEPGRLQSTGSWRVGHDWATSLSLFTFMHWRRKWQPTPVFLPGESQGWGAQSRTQLKWLSSSSIHVYMYMYMHIFMYIHTYVYACVYMYMYRYIYILDFII